MANKQPSANQQPTTTKQSDHGRRKSQIGKQDLYMLMALWIEQSPWAMKETVKERIVGAVFVQPNDRVLSVDCSRRNNGGIVHGAIRALLQYPDQVEGCYVYLSRQPCAHCVKMLVQAAVKKVFYLPLEPEKDEKEENKSVDALFKVSPASREVYVPNITDDDLEELESANIRNPYGIRKLEDESVATKVEWNEEWKKDIVGKIGWDEYSDEEIKERVDEDMRKFFTWFDLGILATGEVEKKMNFKVRGSQATTDAPNKAKKQRLQEPAPSVNQDVANHLSRLAQMLSNRTDDPNRGVGCVIVLKDEIVATGWNGFPSKALYGNHPRRGKAKESEESRPDKFPHVIHAEPNALMRRNTRNLDGATAFVNLIPCNECLPLLCDAGVKALYLSKKAFDNEKKPLEREKNFYELLKKPENSLAVYKQE